MPPAGMFSDFLLAAALSVQLAIAVPLFFYYSQQPEGRTRLQSWFIWPAVLSTAMISAYLLAGIDYRVFRKANVWDVFLTAGALLVVLAITLTVRANRAHADATRPAAPDGANTEPQAIQSAAADILGDLAGRRPNTSSEHNVEVCNSSAEYAQAILAIERHAVRIDRMTKRVSAIFKDPSAAEAIAIKRFGPGSRQAEAYLWEHRERHRIFMENVGQGDTICREIYQIEELRRYFNMRSHGLDVVLDRTVLRRTVQEWLRAISIYQNYYVGLTSDPIPLKYQVFDRRIVVIHEAAGSMDGQRLSTIIFRNEPAVADFQTDFEHVWERIPAEMRSRRQVVAWIKSELLPLLGKS